MFFSSLFSGLSLILIALTMISIVLWWIKRVFRRSWDFPVLNTLELGRSSKKTSMIFAKAPVISFLCFVLLALLMIFLSLRPYTLITQDSIVNNKLKQLWIIDQSASVSSKISAKDYQKLILDNGKKFAHPSDQIVILKSDSILPVDIGLVSDLDDNYDLLSVNFHRSGFKIKSLLDLLIDRELLDQYDQIKIFSDGDRYSFQGVFSGYLGSVSTKLRANSKIYLYLITDKKHRDQTIVNFSIANVELKDRYSSKAQSALSSNKISVSVDIQAKLVNQSQHSPKQVLDSSSKGSYQGEKTDNFSLSVVPAVIEVYQYIPQNIDYLLNHNSSINSNVKLNDLQSSWRYVGKEPFNYSNYSSFNKINLDLKIDQVFNHDNFILKFVVRLADQEDTNGQKSKDSLWVESYKLDNSYVFIPKASDQILLIGSTLGEAHLEDPLKPALWSLQALGYETSRVDYIDEDLGDKFVDLSPYKLIISFVKKDHHVLEDKIKQSNINECLDINNILSDHQSKNHSSFITKSAKLKNLHTVMIIPSDYLVNYQAICSCVENYLMDNIDCKDLRLRSSSLNAKKQFIEILLKSGFKKMFVEASDIDFIDATQRSTLDHPFISFRFYQKYDSISDLTIIVSLAPINPYLNNKDKDENLDKDRDKDRDKNELSLDLDNNLINHSNIVLFWEKLISIVDGLAVLSSSEKSHFQVSKAVNISKLSGYEFLYSYMSSVSKFSSSKVFRSMTKTNNNNRIYSLGNYISSLGTISDITKVMDIVGIDSLSVDSFGTDKDLTKADILKRDTNQFINVLPSQADNLLNYYLHGIISDNNFANSSNIDSLLQSDDLVVIDLLSNKVSALDKNLQSNSSSIKSYDLILKLALLVFLVVLLVELFYELYLFRYRKKQSL